MKQHQSLIFYKEYTKIGIRNNRIFGVLLCMKHLRRDDPHWRMFVDTLGTLFEKYENVDITTMGFPAEWEKLLRA